MDLHQILAKKVISNYGDRDRRFEALELMIQSNQKNNTSNEGLCYVLERIKPNSEVLEFGPASGYVTRFLKEKLNCSVTIIELNEECAQSASAFADAVLVANADNVEEWSRWLGEGRFDHILFCDVLEHLYAPWTVLSVAKTFLKQTGTILCSIPNIAHHTIITQLLESKFEYYQMGLLDITHLRFFTNHTIQAMVDYAGLKITDVRNVYMPARERSDAPWDYISKNPTMELFQRKLSDFSEYLIFQYIFELQNSDSQSRGLSLIDGSSLEWIEYLKDIIKKYQSFENELMVKDEKITSLAENVCEVKNDLERLRLDFLKIKASRLLLIYNSFIKIQACFIVNKSKRKKFRDKYLIKFWEESYCHKSS